MSGRVLPVVGSTQPWHGGDVTEHVTCVLAPNPGPLTLDGTNTWVVWGERSAVVVDPGPQEVTHLQRVHDVARTRDLPIALIVLTHAHPDHSEGARWLSAQTGAPVRALDAMHAHGAGPLASGEVLHVDGIDLRVLGTPGHTDDSVSLHLPADDVLLTGDTVLGRGTPFIAWPEGRLGDYFLTLALLRDLVGAQGISTLLPGHGPMLRDPEAVLTAYLDHRSARLDEVLDAVHRGRRTAAEVVADVYAQVDESLWPAAELSVRAQLEYLRERGEID